MAATVEPFDQGQPLIRVKINHHELCLRLDGMLSEVLLNWPELRDKFDGHGDEITNEIERCSKALCSAFIHMLYNHLRTVTGTQDVTIDRYRTRGLLDIRTPLPSGLIHLIHQFGVVAPKNCFGNNRYLHVWDQDAKDTFGLKTAFQFDSGKFQKITNILKGLNVPFTTLSRSAEYRTAWDTLVSAPSSRTSKDIYTTLPLENYTLPRDAFLFALFITEHMDDDYAVQPSHPRMQYVTATSPINEINLSQDTVDVTVPNKKRKIDAISDTGDIPFAETFPCGPFQYMHNSGISISANPANPKATSGITPIRHIYGLGGPDAHMRINSVVRGMTTHDLFDYVSALIRHGP